MKDYFVLLLRKRSFLSFSLVIVIAHACAMVFVPAVSLKILMTFVLSVVVYISIKQGFSDCLKEAHWTVAIVLFLLAESFITAMIPSMVHNLPILLKWLGIKCLIILLFSLLLNSCYYIQPNFIGVHKRFHKFSNKVYPSGFGFTIPFLTTFFEESVILQQKTDNVLSTVENHCVYIDFTLSWQIHPDNVYRIYQLYGENFFCSALIPKVHKIVDSTLKNYPLEDLKEEPNISFYQADINEKLKETVDETLFTLLEVSDISVNYYSA